MERPCLVGTYFSRDGGYSLCSPGVSARCDVEFEQALMVFNFPQVWYT